MKRTVIFLDDYREPNKYVNCNLNKVYCAFDYNDFQALVKYIFKKYGKVDEVWFDHDLGSVDKGTGLDCAKFLVNFCIENDMKFPEYHIQSANPVGKQNIDSYIKSYLKSIDM